MPSNTAKFVLPLLALVVAAVYARGLPGGFMFDDRNSITANSDIQLESLDYPSLRQAALSSETGPLKRPVSMVSFALSYYANGPDPAAFKAVNIAVHMLIGFALAALAHLLLGATGLGAGKGRSALAWGVAAVWLLHPFNLTPVLFAVQRMTGLATLFIVLALLGYVYGRTRQQAGRRGAAWSAAALGFGLPAAAFSKEIGLLLPLYVLAVELCFFRFAAPVEKTATRLLFGLFLAAPVAAGALYLATHPEWLSAGYANRPFTLAERLMTEARALMWYVRMIVLPDITQMGLHHDDFPVSRGLFDPVSTIASLSALGIMSAGALWLAVRKRAVLAFGPLWFLAGHAMESTAFPLEPVYEHRNYLPSFGLLFTLAYAFHRYAVPHLRRPVAPAVPLVYIGFLAAGLALRAEPWSDPLRLAQRWVVNQPASARAQAHMANLYQEAAGRASGPARDRLVEKALEHYRLARRADPSLIAPLVNAITIRRLQGKAAPPETVESLKRVVGRGPMAASALNSVRVLTHCLSKGPCGLSESDYLAVTEAMLANPDLTDAYRGRLLRYMGRYFGARGDHRKALRYVERALRYRPEDIHFHYDRVEWLAAMERFEQALEAVQRIRQLDPWGKEATRLGRLEKILAGYSRNTGGNE